MTDIKEIRKRLTKSATRLGLCLSLPKEAIGEAAAEQLAELHRAISDAERVLRREGKL